MEHFADKTLSSYCRLHLMYLRITYLELKLNVKQFPAIYLSIDFLRSIDKLQEYQMSEIPFKIFIVKQMLDLEIDPPADRC